MPFPVSLLSKGGVVVMPTDTIYGVLGSALHPKTVARVYRLRKRNPKKPIIVLIGSIADLKHFGIMLDTPTRRVLNRFWPGPVSIILPLSADKNIVRQFRYLHRGTKSIAFRLPKPVWIRRLLKRTGPLVAPSANWEGQPPARTIEEARRYFGKHVDAYVDMGPRRGKPSKLVRIIAGKPLVLRG